MNLSISNLNKPSHPIWKKIADWLLFTLLPALNAMFIYIEAKEVITTEYAMWGVAITTLLITCFKGFTKFTVNEKVTPV